LPISYYRPNNAYSQELFRIKEIKKDVVDVVKLQQEIHDCFVVSIKRHIARNKLVSELEGWDDSGYIDE